MAALALFSALTVVVPLAVASSPDSVTVAGVYDAADYDDVMVLVTSQEVLVVGRQPLVSRLRSSVASISVETNDGGSAAEPRSVQSRAPPTS